MPWRAASRPGAASRWAASSRCRASGSGRRCSESAVLTPPLATIGYQGTTVGHVVAALQAAGVRRLIDVRAVPLSRKPGFSKRQLAAALAEVAIDYVNLRGLGTPPAGRQAARRGDTATMRAIFAAHLRTEAAQTDLALARTLAAGVRCCLLCFEREPDHCHRLLVAEAMTVSGGVQHLHPAPSD